MAWLSLKRKFTIGFADNQPPFATQHHQGPEGDPTAVGSAEALNDVAGEAEDEVAIHGGVECGGEAAEHRDEISHIQVEQDLVEGCPMLLVLDGDLEYKEVDGEAGDDEEEHVCGHTCVGSEISQLVLRVLRTIY